MYLLNIKKFSCYAVTNLLCSYKEIKDYSTLSKCLIVNTDLMKEASYAKHIQKRQLKLMKVAGQQKLIQPNRILTGFSAPNTLTLVKACVPFPGQTNYFLPLRPQVVFLNLLSPTSPIKMGILGSTF